MYVNKQSIDMRLDDEVDVEASINVEGVGSRGEKHVADDSGSAYDLDATGRVACSGRAWSFSKLRFTLYPS